MIEETSENEHSIYTVIEEYVHDKKWSKEQVREFYERLRKYLLYEKNTLIDRLKKTPAIQSVGQRLKERERHRLGYIRAAVLCGIPHSVFGVPESVIFPMGNLLPREEYFSFNFRDENFEKNYVSFIDNYLAKASDEYQVYDYLGRGEKDIPTEKLKEYFDANEKIFDRIEHQLRQGMKYTRILGLHIMESVENNFEDISKLILKQCSPQLFRHMCRCLREFHYEKVQFYVTSKSRHTYQFAILKDKEKAFIYEERYFLDEKGDAYPSFATTRMTEKRREMHLIYDDEIRQQTINRDDMSFRLDTFCECFRQIIEECRQNNLEEIERRARIGFKRITNRKIEIFNDIFRGDPGWKEIHSLEV